MATRRIVDITPKGPPKPEESKEQTSVSTKQQECTTETFNYMVMETREKINDAMQVLFSRDSKLRRLQDKPALAPNEEAAQKAAAP